MKPKLPRVAMTKTSDLRSDAIGWIKGAVTGALLSFSIAGTPSPTCRPRVGKFGTYYAAPYEQWMQQCIVQLSEQKPAEPVMGDLIAYVDVRVDRPKATKLLRPRGDVDNYAKAPLDAATKAALWGDDGQLMAVVITKRWAEPGERPGATIHFGRLAGA